MTATVVSATPAASDVVSKKMEAAAQNFQDQLMVEKGTGMPFWYGDSYTFATTSLDEANDIVRLVLCPPGCYIGDFRGTITDVDTNATPTIVYSVVTLTSANVVVDTLVSASTNGQGGGTDRIANAAVMQYVGDLYIGLKISTGAATAATGTYKYAVQLVTGLLSLSAVDVDPATTDLAI